MANEKDIEKANEGAPAVDIPDLKKKDKERKKSGFAWGGAKPGATPFSGATGGSGVARAAASAANASAGGAAGAAAGGGSSALGGLLATTLGKTLVMAGAAMFLGGGAIVGYSMLKDGGQGGGSMLGDLGGLSSGMKVRKGTNDSTGWLASKGEITFDPKKKVVEPKKDDAKTAEQTAAAPAVDQTADAAGQIPEWKKDSLEHNLSGAKLSSSLGGAFGAKNIFGGAGNSAAPKFNDGMAKSSLGQKGKLSASRASGVRSRVGQRTAGPRLTSNRALGQLRVAKGASMLGAGASTADGARSGAAAAFDGATSQNALEAGGPGAGPQSGAPDTPQGTGGGLGGAAPDVTVDTPTGIALNDDTTAMLAAIGAMAAQAGKLKSTGMMLMLLGSTLMVLGIALIGYWWSAPVGVMIMGLGAALLGAGIAMMSMGDAMASMAKSMGQQLAARTGDVNQAAIVNECTDQALDGTDPANCRVNEDLSHREDMNTIQNDGVQQHQENVERDSAVQEATP